jgi:hypothetical protein
MILLRWMIHLNDKSITVSDASTHPVKEGDKIDLLSVTKGSGLFLTHVVVLKSVGNFS